MEILAFYLDLKSGVEPSLERNLQFALPSFSPLTLCVSAWWILLMGIMTAPVLT